MKIVRKSRKIKSTYVGFIQDGININFNPTRVYSDEIPLPDYSFLTSRSFYWLKKETDQCIDVCMLWHNLSINNLTNLLKDKLKIS